MVIKTQKGNKGGEVVSQVTYLMITRGEIQSDNVHACVEQLTHLLLVLAALAQRADNRRLPLVQVDLLEDVLEANAR